ncbi:ABC transporter permease [Oleomonas cavernae]|uniref:ABC transporter permease n=1 Tax=Oleomonas cavernae TaxID=2320859 RepID=A0A418WTQ7_9PROT|nr:ABC transporter permease [Oleomonas cavernae]RJF94651.1 ABC transporter permease [Oleomonas cavernae]
MSSGIVTRAGTVAFCLLFFGFLFGPLVIMVITAFNSSSFPRIVPWDCFTTDWFGRLSRDLLLMKGLGNSLAIGAGVVVVSTPIGLAAALALSEVGPKLKGLLYTVFISPILMPGIVIGISTLLFWGRIGSGLGFGFDSIFYNGFFLTILGQVCFIAAYSMLVFLARLQRFDTSLTEAALDLGATPGQAFRRILLPFLRPAIFSAAILAFLASLENYNTTVFAIVAESTFTTVLASKVRLGIDPSISAVAVVIIAITLIGAIVHEVHQRRADTLAQGGAAARRILENPVAALLRHPATVATIMIALLGTAVWYGSQHDSRACEKTILDAKMLEQQRLQEQQRQPAPAPAAPSGTAPAPSTPFGGVFTPDNLGGPKP